MSDNEKENITKITDLFSCSEISREEAYLISRGVRALALLKTTKTDRTSMLSALNELEEAASMVGATRGNNVLPFVVKHKSGHYATTGFASHPWVIDLFRWIDDSDVPHPHRSRIIGLLLGYSPDAIAAEDDFAIGQSIFDKQAPPPAQQK